MSPTLFDHGFAFVVLLLLVPLGGWWAFERFLRRAAALGEAALIGKYKEILLWEATLAGGALLCWWWAQRPLAALGFVPVEIGEGSHLALGLTFGALIAFAARPVLVARSERQAEATRRSLGKLAPFLPRTRKQLAWALLISVAAGTCEEIAYRGFLLPYFGVWFGPWTALALSSAVFGLGHLYQGWQGVVATALVGAGFGYVFIATQSLALPMLLHASLDISAMITVYLALQRTPVEPAG